jgi:ribonuclease-3
MNRNIEEVIGYTFGNKALLKQALTHSSAVGAGNSGESCRIANERMEFLGDSVLSVVVSKYLYDSLRDSPEGYLTKLRAKLVCEEALYNYARKIDLGQRLVMGKGEVNSGGRNRKSILSDAFEALIAAIYLDSGLAAARTFILPFLPDKKSLCGGKLITGDYKTVLQELIQQNPDNVIEYIMVAETGAAHDKVFSSEVHINGTVAGAGVGRSKKESQQMAAKEALIGLDYAEN